MASPPEAPVTPKVRRSAAVRAAIVGEEQVLLHLERGHYFRLNPTAAWIWEQLAEPQNLEGLQAGLTRTYEVEGATARADLEELVTELLSESLIELEPAG